MAAIPRQTILHRAGMALSGLCLVHCLLLPVLPVLAAMMPLVLMASLPAGLQAEWLHAALIAPVAVVSGTALWRGGGIGPAVLVAALAALVAALFVANEALETALSVVGAGALLAAHWLSLRRRDVDRLGVYDNIT